MPQFEVTVEITFSGEIVVEEADEQAARQRVEMAHWSVECLPSLDTSALFADPYIDGVELADNNDDEEEAPE